VNQGRDVLIVIPARDEQAHIADVIAAMQSDVGCQEALIVVADDDSQDDTVAIVTRIGQADPRVRVLESGRKLGVCAAINRAVEAFGAGRSWLVRVDAHADYPANDASRLVAKAQEMDASCVVTPMVTCGETCFEVAVAAASNSVLGTGGAAHRLARRGGWVDHGHHALMRLDVFMAVGGYDAGFIANEDADLDARITKIGGRIWLADDLPLDYFPRRSTPALFRQYFRYGQGRAMTVARHGGRRKLRQMLPLLIAPMVGLAALTPLFGPACLPALGYVALCLGYGITLRRLGAPCSVAAGYTAMVMHIGWSIGYWRQVFGGKRLGSAPAPLLFGL